MQIVQWPTRNFGYPAGTHGRNGQQIGLLVNHIMQGTMAGMHAYLADPSKNSATFSVAKDGHVEQHVALTDAPWTNGPMNKPDMSVPAIARCWNEHINPNLISVTIEHEGYSGQPLTEPQIAATIELHKYILAQCPTLKPDRQHIVGHYQIDSVNKAGCPGSAFPWARIMAAIQPVGISATSTVPNDRGEPEQLGALFADWLNAHPGEAPSLVTEDGYHDRLLFLKSGKVLIGWHFTTLGALDVVDRRA